MKLALAQLNTTVGDITGNEAKILAAYQRGVDAGVELVVTPELALVGYPPRDLVHRPSLISQNLAALNRLAAMTGMVDGPRWVRDRSTPRTRRAPIHGLFQKVSTE